MLDIAHGHNCEREHEIVAYLYGELAEGESSRFESHLGECGSCIDAFAELSDPRFAVYEWQRTEFADLPTPRIVIPYETASAGWFSGLKAIFSLPGLVPAAAGAAVLAVVIGGYFLLSTDAKIPTVAAVPTQKLPVATIETPFPAATESEVADPEIRPTVVSSRPVRRDRAVEAKAAAPTPKVRSMTAENEKPLEVDPKPDTAAKAPVLSGFEEEDDRSLRLADLFDDGEV